MDHYIVSSVKGPDGHALQLAHAPSCVGSTGTTCTLHGGEAVRRCGSCGDRSATAHRMNVYVKVRRVELGQLACAWGCLFAEAQMYLHRTIPLLTGIEIVTWVINAGFKPGVSGKRADTPLSSRLLRRVISISSLGTMCMWCHSDPLLWPGVKESELALPIYDYYYVKSM